MSPRMDRHSRAYMGIGDGDFSVDNRFICPFGHAAQPLDDERAIFQTKLNGRYVLATWSEGEGVREIPGTQGANELASGGGRFLAWLAGRGVYGATERPHAGLSPTSTDGRGAAGVDGTLALVPDRQAGGMVKLIAPNGEITETIHAATYGLQILGPHEAIWNGGARGWSPTLLSGASWVRVADVDGVRWLTYWRDGVGLVAHPQGSFRGHIISERDAFYHDVIGLHGRLIVAYSTNQGESVGSLVKVDVFSLPEVDLDTEPDLPPVHVDPLPRRIWMAPYKSYTHQYGATDDHPGNAVLGDPDVAPADSVLILGGEQPLPAHLEDRTIATYAHGSDAGDLEAKVLRALANVPNKPCLAYLDSGRPEHWPEQRPHWMTGRVRANGQLYRDPGESLEAFDQRGTALLRRLASYGGFFGVSPAFYTRNGAMSEDDILACMPLYDRWMREFPIVDFLPFADLRPTGMVTHPIFRAWAKAFFAANPGRPRREDYWVPDGSVPPIPVEPPVEPEPNMNILLFDYPREYQRSEPRGWVIGLEVEHTRPVLEIVFEQEGTNDPLSIKFNTKNDGRYWRTLGPKLVHDADVPIRITATDDQNQKHTVKTEKVRVFSGPFDPPPPQGEITYGHYGEYVARRWHELGVHAASRAIAAREGFANAEEYERLNPHKPDSDPAFHDEPRYLRIAEEGKGIQCHALIRIAGELHHAQGHADVGLNVKDGGNRYEDPRLPRAMATDIVCVKPTIDGRVVAGPFHIVDVMHMVGSPFANVIWDDHGVPSDEQNQARPFMEPPVP